MANAKFADMVDPRLLEAAWHRYEAARDLAQARSDLSVHKERYARACNVHMKAVEDYNTLEADIARGVRIGAGAQAVQS